MLLITVVKLDACKRFPIEKNDERRLVQCMPLTALRGVPGIALIYRGWAINCPVLLINDVTSMLFICQWRREG